MMHRLFPAALLLALPLLAAPASAGTWSAPDPSGDVVGVRVVDEESCTTEEVDGSEVTSQDLVRVTVRHTRRDLVFVVQHRDLRRSTSQSVSVDLRAPKGRHWRVLAFREAGTARVEPVVGGQVPTKAGCEVVGFVPEDCGARGRAAFADDKTTIRVPRGCVRRPQWVRAAVSVGGQEGATETFWFDNWAPADAADPDGPDPFGPRVRVG